MMRAMAITVSTRAAAGTRTDTSGLLLAQGLAELGFQVVGPVVVPDGAAVGDALVDALEHGYDLIVTTGGTGLSASDRTPEYTAPMLERLVPGISEAVRERGVRHGVASAVLSRGLAGTVGTTLIVNLAGSPGAVRDGLGVLAQVAVHAIDQLRGGDHT